MDEKKGHEISFVQFPQNYDNITKNDIYACSISVANNVSNLWLRPCFQEEKPTLLQLEN